MRNKAKEMWTKWRHYSFPSDALLSCIPQIRSHNIRLLKLTSLLAVILLIAFSFFPIFIDKNLLDFFMFLGVVAIQVGIFICANHQHKKPEQAKNDIFFVYCILFFSMLFFGIFVAVQTAYTVPAINFYVMLVLTQMLFIFDPIRTLLLNLVVLGLLFAFCLRFTPAYFLRVYLVNGTIAAAVGLTFSWYASYFMIREILTAKKLEEERSKFKEQSIKDELTGLSNRRDFLNAVTFYTSVCQHVHQSVCVIMMDVDHFKNYNDFYGHAQGDLVLKSIGDVLKKLVQEKMVFAARVGGEEFIILWTENRLNEAEYFALKLKEMINDLQIPHAKSDAALHVTASYGLYFLRGGSMETVDELYEKAEQALYEAKKRGRNCIVLVDSDNQSEFELLE
jgi:diguanylate cyclase (GGDEF)-like protein